MVFEIRGAAEPAAIPTIVKVTKASAIEKAKNLFLKVNPECNFVTPVFYSMM